MTRDALIAAFLAEHGYQRARAEPIASDADLRRYLRLTGGPHPALLMDAAPQQVAPFLRIAAHLAGAGISVPTIFAASASDGLVLEEDFGDELFHTAMRTRSPELLFDAAIDVLVEMQRPAPPADLPDWDAPTMAQTALATIFDWWWPATFGAAAPDAARREFAAALDTVLAPVASGPHCFVHRDFFVGNLLWLPDRTGLRRVGVIDFQGASIGHPAYDLVSLIQDSRRVIPADLAERSVARYLAARPELDPDEFRAALAACAAQRHLRIVGQWVRLARRDGKPNYLPYGPHTWRLLEAALTQPAAAPLAAAMDRWIPPARRGNPPDLAA
jgi:N-acetylmuramate 1-kinase